VRLDHHEVIVKTQLKMDGVRLNWDYQIVSLDGQELFVTAQVTLVGIDAKKGKIMRQLPSNVTDAIIRKK
jgi:acyl-CoA thioester hydrolase